MCGFICERLEGKYINYIQLNAAIQKYPKIKTAHRNTWSTEAALIPIWYSNFWSDFREQTLHPFTTAHKFHTFWQPAWLSTLPTVLMFPFLSASCISLHCVLCSFYFLSLSLHSLIFYPTFISLLSHIVGEGVVHTCTSKCPFFN